MRLVLVVLVALAVGGARAFAQDAGTIGARGGLGVRGSGPAGDQVFGPVVPRKPPGDRELVVLGSLAKDLVEGTIRDHANLRACAAMLAP
jgi:hypothetical protein